jgi:hypothetical protein
VRARFVGNPNNGGEGPSVLPLLGLQFVKGEWQNVPVEAFARLSRHNHFEVDANDGNEPAPTVESLRAECDARGITYHHLAGVRKLTELLEG